MDANRRQQMDILYSPSRWCRRLPADEVVANHVTTITKATELARSRLVCELDVRYGPTDRQKYDIYYSASPSPPDTPIVILIHGGYWQMLSKEESGYVAEIVALAQGICVVVDYDLCPSVSMDELVSQVYVAVRQVHQLARERGSSGLYLVGHSAGAHLAALALNRMKTDLDDDLLKGALLISGIFDLRPLLETSVNNALKMSEQEAWSLSPQNPINFDGIRSRSKNSIDIVVVVAENDSPAFHQQSRDYAKVLQENGLTVELIIVADTDHFDVVERLTEKDYQLSQILVALLSKSRRQS